MHAALPERHVVLVAPEIHWNTGNIGRTCLGVGARLHLIRPLGFSLESRHVKRAGLDYWPQVEARVWECFEDFASAFAPRPVQAALFTKTGARPFWDMPRPKRLILIFGSETRGLPPAILSRFSNRETFHIPILDSIRSLNLSTAVAVGLYESIRGACAPFHAWPEKA